MSTHEERCELPPDHLGICGRYLRLPESALIVEVWRTRYSDADADAHAEDVWHVRYDGEGCSVSDVRPELQQIRETLHGFVGVRAEWNVDVDVILAALARVEATLNAQQHHCVYPECVVGEQPELCGHCGDAERAEAAEARVVAAEADAVKWQEYGLRMSNDACLAEDRAVAAEAERDALVAALERIADVDTDDPILDEVHHRILDAAHHRKIARDALASVSATGASGALQNPARPAPAEPPERPT